MFFALRKLAARPAGRPSTAAALGSAVGIALAGAVLWAVIARLFNVQLSLLGVAIGAGVGYAVARFRPGSMPVIVTGAVIAVAGCALGTFLAIIFELVGDGVGLSSILSHLNIVFHVYPSAVGGLGFVFWAIAAFAAIRVPLQSQRIAARAAARGPAGYGSAAAGYGQPPAGPGGAPDAGLPPFTGPAGPLPPGPADPA
jgi:hypothetical protein